MSRQRPQATRWTALAAALGCLVLLVLTAAPAAAAVGDQDGDTDIDIDDIAIILAARNTPAGPADPKDLDSDGVVTVLDARIAAACCTRALCATGNNAPTITSGAAVNAAENQTAATDVQATDPDGDTEGAGLTYSLTGGADQALFSIVAATGVLTFNAAPDFESPGDANADNVYEVQVTVTDSGALTDVQDLQVTVTDVNEAPTITSGAAVNAAENQTVATDVQSTDPEGDSEGAGLTYSLTGGADQALFSIVAATGVLTFNAAPDFESPGDANADNVYEVDVTVTDSGTLTDVQTVMVTVTDVVENTPPTITSGAAVSVAENQTAVIDVQSTDPEGETEGAGLTYSLTGGADQALFSIVAATGVLTFNAAPDFENPGDANTDNVYEVQVTVTDSGALTDVQNLQVTVTDVNEAPTITSGATPSAAENQTAVTDVQSTDPEGETEGAGLTYSLTGGADQALFSIVAATGVLTFNAAPDFENPGDANTDNVYEVQVTVTDSGTLTDVQDLQVTVTDVNEAPTITSGATPSVSENQTGVTDVMSTDPEGETEGAGLTYGITGGADQALLSIVAATGVLTFTAAPDFENPGDANTDNVYEVQVTVTDSGTLTDVQDLQVTVTGVNEAPTITSGATPSVSENQTGVTDVMSSDPEGETEGAGLTYGITGGADQGLFSIVAATGVLTFNAAPDFENPGDANMDNVYEVQVTVTDSGTLTGVQTLNVTVTNQPDPPVIGASPATFATAGCTQIRAGGPSTPPAAVAFVTDADAIHAKASITDQDTAVPGGLTFSVFSPPSNGTLNLEADGTFAYVPDATFTGPTDSFQYQVTDGVTPVVGTINVNVSEMVRYVHTVQGDTAANGNTGCSDSAFDNFGDVETTSTANDVVFVFEGDTSTTALDDSFDLKDRQKLHGEGIGLTVPGFGSLVAAGNEPVIDFTGGDAVTVLADTADRTSIEIRGLSLSGSTNAVDVTANNTFQAAVTVSDNTFVDSGSEAIDLNPNSSGDFTATVESNVFSTASPTGNAFDLVTTASAGNVELAFNNNTDITSSSGTAVNIDGSAGGSLFITGFAGNTVHGNTGGTGISILGATFDSDTSDPDFDLVAAGTTAVGSSGNPVGASGMILGNSLAMANRVSGNLAFAQLDVFNSNGTGLAAAGSAIATGGPPPTAGFQLAVTTGTIAATGGPAVDFDPLTANATFAQVVSASSGTSGVSLVAVDGAVTLDDGGAGSSISGATGTAFNVDGGSATISYAGTIANTAGRSVAVANRVGGAGNVTFSGDIGSMATPNTGTGIFADSNAGGTIEFSGNVFLSTGANDAVTLTSNGGTTINFSGGGLGITTTSGNGFVATGGASAVNVTGSGNKVSTTTGTAVNVTSTTIGASGMTFESISANGAANGIVLNTTGTMGDFVVTGNGGSCTAATPTCTGGRIQSTVGADGGVPGNGVSLSNTGRVSLSFIRIDNHPNHAIRGSTVNGFALIDSLVDGANGNNDSIDEGSVRFDNLLGSAEITRSQISGGHEDNLRLVNTTGSLNRLVITDSTFRDNSSALGNDGILIESRNASVVNVTVTGTAFTGHRGDHFDANATDTSTLDVVFTGNTLSGGHPSPLGQSFILSNGASADVTFNVSNNGINGAILSAFTFFQSAVSTASSSLIGTFSDNTIGTTGVAGSGSVQGHGTVINAAGNGTVTVLADNNEIRQWSNEHGLLVQAGDGSPTVNVTVTNHTIKEPNTTSFPSNGLHLNAGTTAAGAASVCLDVKSNDMVGAGAFGADDFRLRQRNSSTVNLPGYGGGSADTAAVVSFVQGNNTGTPTGSASVSGSGGGFTGTGTTCPTPP